MKTINTFNIGILGKMDATEVAEKIRAKKAQASDEASKAAEKLAIEKKGSEKRAA